MSLALVRSRALVGILAPEVLVETHLANGLPGISIVGLPETEVKESKDRVRGALMTARFEVPARRITVNLAPADLPKEGARFDLAIALGILAASEQLPSIALERYEFLGELALSGALRPVRGVLAAALRARDAGRALIVPQANAAEAALVSGVTVYGANDLLGVCAHLMNQLSLAREPHVAPALDDLSLPDLAEVRGQHQARRALEIAAAGGHSLLFLGPPGTGKSMLAARLPGILPRMTDEEAIEAAAVQSASHNGFVPSRWRVRPFRNPHHTASGVALVGGGSSPMPGEISLAHHGVLFLDELPEFDRRVLEVLREPLESGAIVISRAARQAEFPARFQLVAAMNPCPCGYLGDPAGRCHCTADQVRNYRGRLSGPLIDRLDMHVEVPALPREALLAPAEAGTETSATVRARVQAARDRALARQNGSNARLTGRELEHHARLDEAGQQLITQAGERLGLSARATHRVLRLARTIADLADSDAVLAAHLAEAIQYRVLDRRPAPLRSTS